MTESHELAKTFDILRRRFPDYENRPQQLEMAQRVLDSLNGNRRLLVEAGTGVGKTFAYLIPAILLGGKTVVSTASIALQDQLVNKDLVSLRDTLPQEFSFGLLKGKNNYLCLKREREFAEIGGSYKKFREWISATETGDKDELGYIPDFWPQVCGDSDDCNSLHCPFYSSCFYYGHLRNVRKKDILVVNHHLLIYDLLSGFNLLPSHDKLIIDEAHQIENIISQVSGNTLSGSRLQWLLYRLKGLKIAVDQLMSRVGTFFSSPPDSSLRGGIKGGNAVAPVPDSITEGLANLKSQLALDKVVNRLGTFRETVSDDELKDRIETTINSVGVLSSVIDDFINQSDDSKVYYLLRSRNAFELKSNLVECQKTFGFLVSGYESVVMTSATLTTDNDFSFVRARLGITAGEEAMGFEEKVIGSPFDYRRQALLYLEKELPAPDNENADAFYREGLVRIEELIKASRGRALVLFTSYRHLNFVSENISIDFPLKAQGDMPPARLIEWFRKTPHSVLLATATFWQGIDVKGDKLSLVIITRIPFGSPGDPLYDERCRRLGERWFKDLALPSAILLLRQGFGRLIRAADDYGVVAILDSRVMAGPYARSIVSSLPVTDITHSIGDVKAFFDSTPNLPDRVVAARCRPRRTKVLDNTTAKA